MDFNIEFAEPQIIVTAIPNDNYNIELIKYF